MKRIINFAALAVAVALLLCSCGKDMERLNYNYDMTKYVELDSYAVEVDTASVDYKKYYSEKLSELLVGEVTEGKVEYSDTANIDYTGKKDGVAFSGGTDYGYDLVIGSGSFIDGFEEGLVGAQIGSTVDLNLTFPEDYGKSDLAGEDVVFTVTVNYVMREYDELTDDTAKLCGYESAAEVEAVARDYAKQSTAWSNVFSNAKIEEYPEKETELYVDALMQQVGSEIYLRYGITLEEYVSYSGLTMDELRQSAKESSDAANMCHSYALSYYIIDKAGVKVTDQMVTDKIAEFGDNVNTSISRNYFEALVVNEMAVKIVLENATVK